MNFGVMEIYLISIPMKKSGTQSNKTQPQNSSYSLPISLWADKQKQEVFVGSVCTLNTHKDEGIEPLVEQS